ncbi:hypothetical protein IV203_033946 [Nitzschia inconspicua]|uniref:Uncharacterized protein n=1 Tax=Nitzschia inconspicua TaxID=303405 RepID=A0A9K3M3N3_9STRA|nr:hypothetical protein IV203_033946 [Nitzschia inconspicua]
MIRRSLSSRTMLSAVTLCLGFLASFSFVPSNAKATSSSSSSSIGSPILMDTSGGLRLKIPTIPTNEGVVAIITSPGSIQSLLTAQSNDDNVLALEDNRLICRGATLQSMTAAQKSALALTSLVATVIVMDGITIGDILAAGWKNTRHARTLTALFRARLALDVSSSSSSSEKQTLVLCVKTDSVESVGSTLMAEVKALFEATVVETKASGSFDDLYTVVVKSVSSKPEAEEVLTIAKDLAAEIASSSSSESSILASVLQEANERIKESGITTVALDPPHIAHAFVAVSNAHAKQAKSARAKIATWKSRAVRGLWTDGFGAEAEAMRKRILSSFDSETLSAAGLPLVAPYRLEKRNQLAALVDSSIADLFSTQVKNLESRTLKRLHAQLLKRFDKIPVEEVPSENAASIRAAMFSFDNIMNELEVPSLSLTKTKACREMEAKLTDEVATFDDSPAAQIKRMKKVTEVTNKEKKPGQRSIDFGLDLVAVLRPDGYGSLQGYAGYNLGGSSITFGIHNDADDPQTIAQFGGVRPPLLRVQPKLRVDIEM